MAGCGGGGSNGVNPAPAPVSPVVWSQQKALTVTRDAANTEVQGVWTMPYSGKLILPAVTDYIVNANGSNGWQVNVSVNGTSLSCEYAYTIPNFVVNICPQFGIGYFSVNAGDIVTVRVSTAVTQFTNVGITLVGHN